MESRSRTWTTRDEEDLVSSDDVLELLTGELKTIAGYLQLAARTDLPEVVQVHVATRVGGSMLAYHSGEGAPGVRAARVVYRNPSLTPLAIAVAATELASCTDSGLHVEEVTTLLLAHPSCTPAARVRAAWSLTVGNGFYLQHRREATEAALRALGEGCGEARLAATFGKLLRAEDDSTFLSRRHPASAFAVAVGEVYGLMGGSEAAAETFCALLPEWEGETSALAEAVAGLLRPTGRGSEAGTVAA